jgi:hypothetical protein
MWLTRRISTDCRSDNQPVCKHENESSTGARTVCMLGFCVQLLILIQENKKTHGHTVHWVLFKTLSSPNFHSLRKRKFWPDSELTRNKMGKWMKMLINRACMPSMVRYLRTCNHGRRSCTMLPNIHSSNYPRWTIMMGKQTARAYKT